MMHIPPTTTGKKSANYADLKNKLYRIRRVLTQESMMLNLIPTELEFFPDPIDQAASEHLTDIAPVGKLRRIEQALTPLHTHSYEICSRHGHESLSECSRFALLHPLSSRHRSKIHQKFRLCRTPSHPCPHIGVRLRRLAHLAPGACLFLPGEGTRPGL